MIADRAVEKISADHLRRDAYLYVRQSTLRQVMENTTSTDRQYGLRQRAVALGWAPDQVVVIDQDLGRSGASVEGRDGFQRLVADVGMGKAGIVIGLELSRLARNNADWHRLLEICALTETLILDEDGLYDPCAFNDRLLLGMKGQMSEAELHLLKARLRGGQLTKARTGELWLPLPVGFVYDSASRVVLDADQSVRDAVAHLFATFERTGSARAAVKAFAAEGLRFPSRVQTGPNKGTLAWLPLLHHRALQVLHNPRYAGAFVYGRRRQRRGPDGRTRHALQPREAWTVLILDAHPGYISWDRYEDNLRRLALVVEDGMGDQRRSRRFDKATHGLSRLVVIGSTGYVSLDALHWCRRVGIPVLVIAPDGTPALASADRGMDDPRLRRAQVFAAAGSDVALGIVKHLLAAKMSGQSAVARTILGAPAVADTLEAHAALLADVRSVEQARAIEAVCAQLYFSGWPTRDVLRFVAKDRKRVPPHWTEFAGRRSALRKGNSNQRAERPVNALLSYCFRLGEAECLLALAAVGLDAGCGFLHADYPGRPALALDLLEVVRPDIEAFVLRLVAERAFRKQDFVELPDGHVRLMPGPLTHDLVEAISPMSAKVVAAHAEAITHALLELVPGRTVKRTPLTEARRKAAVHRVRAQRSTAPKVALPARTCEGCGAAVDRPDYAYCVACRPQAKERALVAAHVGQAAARARRKRTGEPDPSTAHGRGEGSPSREYRQAQRRGFGLGYCAS
jgi:CRISPR-associated endonuclease Cas1